MSIFSRLMGKGNKAFIEALLWKLGKEHYATVFRIYYSGFVYKAATCVLHPKTNTVLLVFSAKLFSSVELMTNNMLEEISGQSKIIYYSTVTTKTEKLHFCTMKQYEITVCTIPSSVNAISSTYWNAGEVNS